MAISAAQLNVVFTSAGHAKVRSEIESLGDAVEKAGAVLTGLGAAGGAGLGLMTQDAMEFSAAMSNVNSIARLSGDEMEMMEDRILGLSAAYGAMPTDLAAGMYDIIGSGFEDAAEAALILETAVVAAGAGMTDTSTSVRAITAVLNAYGMEAESAGDVSDVLFKTVDSGVISFEALANNLGNTIPLASNLGVSIEELGAAYAELTLQGIGASQAETQIASLMRSAISPTEDLTAAVEGYGYASAEALIQSEGLVGYLQFLEEASGGTSAGLQDLVGTAEAVNAALALSRNEGENYAAMLETMGGAAQDGAYTLEVFGLQMDNAAGSIRMAQAEISAASIAMGQAFEPLVGAGADAVASLVGAFNDLSGPGQQAIATFAGIASGAAIVQGGMMLAIPKIVEFRNAMMSLQAGGSFLSVIGRAAGPVSLALGGLAAAGIYTWSTFQEGRESAEQLEDALIQLGDVATNLRLGHRDEEAEFVEGFRKDLESVQDLADDYARLAALDLPFGDEDQLDDISRAYERTGEEIDEITEAQTALGAAFANSQVDAEALNAHLRNLYNQYIAGTITLDEYDDAVIDTAANIDQFRISAEDLAMTLESTTLSIAEFNTELGKSIAASQEDADGIDTLEEALSSLQAGLEDGTIAADEFAAQKAELDRQMATGAISIALYEEELINLARSYEEAGEGAGIFGEVASTALEGAIAKAEEARAAVEELQQLTRDFISSGLELAGDGDFLSQWNMTGRATEASFLAESINDVSASMDELQRVIIGNTDALGTQMQGLEDWALGLINVKGEVGEIDKLLSEGRITWDQYTDAQAAQVEISEANATVQRDLLAIQAMQAPLLAENATAMAEYVEQLRLMNDGTEEGAQQQLAALAMMDGAVMGQVQQFTEMVGMMGRLGPEGAQSMQMFIDSIVAANPALTAVLIEMGLIEEAANGQYVLNLDAAGAVSEIEMLNTTLGHLIDTLNGDALGTYALDIGIDVEGTEDVDAAKQSIQDLAALSAQERMIEIGTKVLPPEPGSAGWEEWNTAIEPLPVPSRLEVPSNIRDIGLDIPPLSLPVELDFSGVGGGAAGLAQNAAQQALEAAGGSAGQTIDITVNLTDNASAGLLEIGSILGGLDAASATVVANGNNAPALTAVDMVRMALNDIDGQTSLISILGDNASAMGAIGEVAAYDGVVLATSYHDIVVRQFGSASAVGAGIGAGLLAGFDNALGINSPSDEMIDRGQYMFQGLDIGWQQESRDLPVGVGSVSASLPFVGSEAVGYGGGGAFAPTINISIDATGKDIDEERIVDLTVDQVMDAIVVAKQRQDRAMGVTAW